jgi:DNA-directed RNA polymerase specialized sigma24 family protein
MASVHRGSALRQINRLFDEGTLAGLPDARLLERYARERDELAFESLVQRHGAMVMAVCRGVVADADDAFQAAFLLLAREAERLWVNDSLGGWLHRVACRIALQLRSDTARRRDQERQAAERALGRCRSAAPWDDVPTVLHQEIDRLPERYRKPIVLCYLDGLMVLAGEKVPYFVTCMRVPDQAGLEPVEADVDCQPGIPVRLKLIDKETGKPLRNADVFYEPIFPNPHTRQASGYSPVQASGPYNSGVSQDDGTYLIGVLPGPGGIFG